MITSKHFTLDEFACHDGTQVPEAWEDRVQALCGVLDVIRETWGQPLKVVSGYRTWEYNQSIRGAKDSQHVQARAADVTTPGLNEKGVERLHRLVLSLYRAEKLPGLGGLGLYPGWIHVDVRAHGGHLAQWTGTGVGAEK